MGESSLPPEQHLHITIARQKALSKCAVYCLCKKLRITCNISYRFGGKAVDISECVKILTVVSNQIAVYKGHYSKSSPVP